MTDRERRIEEALEACLDELEAAIRLLAREGVIHSESLGKKNRDDWRAALALPKEEAGPCQHVKREAIGAVDLCLDCRATWRDDGQGWRGERT